MFKVEELKDELLENVTGGGSGTIPQNGITFDTYSSLEAGYYYSSAQNTNNVVYVYSSSNGLGYTSEAFSVDPSTNSWISRNKTPSGVVHIDFNTDGFMKMYPYRLNVRP